MRALAKDGSIEGLFSDFLYAETFGQAMDDVSGLRKERAF
jgi:hypothetical protein